MAYFSLSSQYSLENNTQNEAAEGLLRLRDSITIHPLQPLPDYHFYQLPPISDLLLSSPSTTASHPPPPPPPFYNHYNDSWNSCDSSSKLLYSPTDDSSSITYTYPYSQGVSSTSTLIDPLTSSSPPPSVISTNTTTQGSLSTSPHSLKMATSGSTTVCCNKKKKENFLSRAATFTRRRGRPRKSKLPKLAFPAAAAAATVEEPAAAFYEESNATSPTNKPRWQDAEKRELIEAIVKEKNLDDMTSIRWDRISMTVGRAKKACKDQWRRVLLPDLLKRAEHGGHGSNNSGSSSRSSSSELRKGKHNRHPIME